MKITLGLASLLIITALILGGIIAYSAFPREVTVTKTVIEPGPVVEKEVIKEVEVAPNYKQQVADALMDEVSSDKDFRECSGDEYETDEISIKKSL